MIYAKMCGFKALNVASKQIEQVKSYSPRTRKEPSARRSEAHGCRLLYHSLEEWSLWGEAAQRLTLRSTSREGNHV